MTQVAARAPAGAEPRSRKGARTRARLVDAARSVFERDGFLDARIVDITDAAGVGAGTFYHYFDSKEEIFREVAAIQEEQLLAIPAELPESNQSANEMIRWSNRTYLEQYRDHAALMGVIEQMARYDEEVGAARMSTLEHFFEQAERNIRALQQQGAIDRDVDPAIAAEALGAMINRFAELLFVQGFRDYDFNHVVEQLSLLCAKALGLGDPSRPRSRATSPKRKGR